MENDYLSKNSQNDQFREKKSSYESRHIYEEAVKNKLDAEYNEKRGRRAFGYVWNVVWSLVFIIFFNFFSRYIAYFQFEKVDGTLQWNVYPIITAGFSKLVPLITAGLVVILIGNIILLIFDRYVLSRIVEILSSIFAIAALANIILVFPFDFNVIPYDQLSGMLSLILKILFGLVIFILVILIITNFVKIVIKIAKR
ncbi:MAG TPA: hypothetical protein GXZ93_05505 [Actinobacteria bacterium]|nr:hypothetical protein [Actinomycetota bacterium]